MKSQPVLRKNFAISHYRSKAKLKTEKDDTYSAICFVFFWSLYPMLENVGRFSDFQKISVKNHDTKISDGGLKMKEFEKKTEKQSIALHIPLKR